MRVVDIGCGTGELTANMHRRLQAREAVGIDSSESMLAKAKAVANGTLRFMAGDIGQFAARGEYDLVFSLSRKLMPHCSIASASRRNTSACRSTVTSWSRATLSSNG